MKRPETIARVPAARPALLRPCAAAMIAALLLSGCGPEVVGAAAGDAAATAAQLRQAQEQKARAEAQVRALEKAQQEHVDNIDRQVERAAP